MTSGALHGGLARRSLPAAPRAFSLVELIIVIAIMGIIAAVMVPKYASSLSRSRTRDESNRLLAASRFGQGMAALQRATYWLKINLDTQSYCLERGASRGDDFDVSTDQLSAGGYGSSSYTTPSLPTGEEGKPVAGAGRSAAGSVDIFDEAAHTLPLGVWFIKVADASGAEFSSGEYAIPLDPRGFACDTTIYLSSDREKGDVYSVHIGANGLTEVNVERKNR